MDKGRRDAWQRIWEASNKMEAIFIEGRLRAAGIPVHIVSESAAELYGITAGELARADVYVPAPLADKARAVLAEDPSLPPEADPPS